MYEIAATTSFIYIHGYSENKPIRISGEPSGYFVSKIDIKTQEVLWTKAFYPIGTVAKTSFTVDSKDNAVPILFI